MAITSKHEHREVYCNEIVALAFVPCFAGSQESGGSGCS